MVGACREPADGDGPLLLDMISADLKIVLSIITGRGKEVLNEAENWDHA
jgi:hypothetical protein